MFPECPGLRFFLHDGGDGSGAEGPAWRVYEAFTGMALGRGATPEEARRAARLTLRRESARDLFAVLFNRAQYWGPAPGQDPSQEAERVFAGFRSVERPFHVMRTHPSGDGERGFVPVAGEAVNLFSAPGLEFFTHRITPGEHLLSEASSGCLVAGASSLPEVLREAEDMVEAAGPEGVRAKALEMRRVHGAPPGWPGPDAPGAAPRPEETPETVEERGAGLKHPLRQGEFTERMFAGDGGGPESHASAASAEETPEPESSARPMPFASAVEGEERDGRETAAPDEPVDFAWDPVGGLPHPTGVKSRAAANVAALRVLRTLEREGRSGATAEERRALAAYSSWGGMREFFNPQMIAFASSEEAWKRGAAAAWSRAYGNLHREILELCSPGELEAMRESELTAYYTPPEVCARLWETALRLGFKGGTVLEPGCGTGAFIMSAPEEVRARTRFTGIECDPVTASIARLLYPRARIIAGRMEETALPPGGADLVIGNVPFGAERVHDPALPPMALHNYCLARSLLALKPGGIAVVLTSRHTMDARREERAWLRARAALIDAVRLPDGIFKAHNSGAGADLLVFQRGPCPAEGIAWSAVEELPEPPGAGGAWRGTVPVNEYFLARPERVWGAMTCEPRQGSRLAVDGETSAELWEGFISSLPENIMTQERAAGTGPAGAAEGEREFERRHEGTHRLAKDGHTVVFVEEGAGTEPEWMKAAAGRERKAGVAREFIALADAFDRLLWTQGDPGASGEEVEALRARAAELYREHVRRRGRLLDPRYEGRFLRADARFPAVCGLERERETEAGREIIEAPVLSERTVRAKAPPDSVSGISDACSLSLAWRGKLDPAWIGSLLGTGAEEAEEELLNSGLAFRDPATGAPVPAAEYLSGPVRRKLKEAEHLTALGRREFAANAEALCTAQPPRVPLVDISLRPAQRWIPAALLGEFASEVLGDGGRFPVHVLQCAVSGTRTVAGDPRTAAAGAEYGLPDFAPLRVFEHLVNGAEPVFTWRDDDGKTRVDAEKTAVLKAKADLLQSRFIDWARDRPEAAARLEEIYNETFNGAVTPKYDGSHLALPGLSDRVRREPHQMNAVWRLICERGGLLAHQVGGGKTFTMIMAAREMKRLGLMRKPLMVVENATVEQFAAAWREAYPDARVLVAGRVNFSASRRRRFLGSAAAGDWDAVILTHSAFDLVPCSPETEMKYVREELAALDSAMIEAKEAGGARVNTKELLRARRRLRKRLDGLAEAADKRQDHVLCFEQLGVDGLFIDEAHRFKKLPVQTRLRVRGIDVNPSQRAMQLEIKTRWLRERTGGGNVILATGTPLTNTMAEAYVMLRLAAPAALEERGIQTFDQFAANFGEVVTRPELDEASGRWKMVSRMARFINGPALTAMIRSGWDVVMGKELILPGVPEIKGGAPELCLAELSPENERVNRGMLAIATWYERLPAVNRAELSWVPIYLIQTGMAAALDPRLVGVPSSGERIRLCADRVAEIYASSSATGGTQLIFADRYRPMDTSKLRMLEAMSRGEAGEKLDIAAGEEEGESGAGEETEETEGEFESAGPEAGWTVYEELRRQLTARGVPREEIAIAGEHDHDREALFAAVNAGRVRVLIGSTAKMGTGVNVQRRLAALHELDAPRSMTPADLEQRGGRILRQGNLNKEVRVLRYGMKRTADAGMFHRIETKQRFIAQILCGEGRHREFEDPVSPAAASLAEMKAELTGDPRIMRLVELSETVRRLKLERTGFHQQRSAAAERRVSLERGIGVLEEKHARALLTERWARGAAAPVFPLALTVAAGSRRVETVAEDAEGLEETLASLLKKKPFVNCSLVFPGGLEIELSAPELFGVKPRALARRAADPAAPRPAEEIGRDRAVSGPRSVMKMIGGLPAAAEEARRELEARVARARLEREAAGRVAAASWERDGELDGALAELADIQAALTAAEAEREKEAKEEGSVSPVPAPEKPPKPEVREAERPAADRDGISVRR